MKRKLLALLVVWCTTLYNVCTVKLYFCGNVGEAQLRRRGDPQKRKRVQELSSDEEELEGIEYIIMMV